MCVPGPRALRSRSDAFCVQAHFKKDWQFRVRVKLNQAKRKYARRLARKQKAAAVAPRPAAGMLRPAVRAQTQRYNSKVRAGRGFTLEELKEAGVKKLDAKARGIAIDYRRRNHSVESLQLNVQRLKGYLARVVVDPKKVVLESQLVGPVAKIAKPAAAVPTMKITDDMKKAEVVRGGKQAVATHKLEGKRRWAKEKKDDDAPSKKDGGEGGDEE